MQHGDTGLALAWQAFVENGQLNTPALKPVIAQSWERSLEYGVNPHSVGHNEILEAHILKEKLASSQLLLDTAAGPMESLYRTLQGLGFTVLLADNDGYILKTVGDAEFLDKAKRVCLSAGANWSEKIKGTNAIGTVLKETNPVNVFGWEHYCQENHFLVCSAIPIMGPKGELLGVLDVTGDSRGANDRLSNLLAMAVKNIEKDLLLQDLLSKYKFSKQKNAVLSEVVSEGLISINKEGMIREINPVATSLLGFQSRECIGKPVAEVLNSQQVWCFNSQNFEGEVTVKGQDEKRLLSRGQRVLDEEGNHLETVATLKPIPEPVNVTELVNVTEPVSVPVSTPGAGSGLDKAACQRPLRYSFARIMGESESMSNAVARAKRVSASHSTVLIQGETGTGKELFAQSIHRESPRKDGPFVAINCAAIPKELVESELFGYEEGSFTGAKRGGSIGKFEAAQGGTLFLDEIGDMSLTAQTALLRVLQEKQITRVGGRKLIPVDVRVIAATHRSLDQAVEQGTFRRDLYYRLNVVNILIPPLRDREADSLLLAGYFLRKYCAELGRTELQLSPEAGRSFLSYDWPGNIRELENTIEGLVNIIDGTEILPEHLPTGLQHCTPSASRDYSPFPAAYKGQKVITLREMEKAAILQALESCQGNISVTAQVLGIGRNTLHRKLKEYDLRVV